ncbi:MAG: Glyoxalase/bleomycin resistance protein/dioxygenase [Pedosphaera sp.]|nr:Glyoxalase/bleomycin resistance protein/dioxygenase [Pedosphaera sp.]
MTAIELPDETRVGVVHLRTANLERALGFYRDVLGLSASAKTDASVALSATPSGPALVVLTEDAKASHRPPRSVGLFHLALRYPTRRDLAQALLRLARNDYAIDGASDHRVSEAIYLSDPEGNGVELYADRLRSQWPWQQGQVAMTTEPLDLDDLLATIKGESEMAAPPPRTDMGHVHLHVADLAKARRFFNEFLGLTVTQSSYPGALFLAAGGYHHHVGVNTWAGPGAPPPNSTGLISYRLEVPTAKTLSELSARARSFGYEAHSDSDHLLRIRDPNGNWLEIGVAEPVLVISPR